MEARGALVLVVEDEEDIRMLLRFQLGQAGYEVEVAADGEEALTSIERDVPDLVLLDLRLPRRDGYDVLRRMRASLRTRHVPVVVLSAHSRDEDITHALEAGADDFLVKPAPVSQLLERIQGLLAGTRALHARTRAVETEARTSEQAAPPSGRRFRPGPSQG